jgi:hypothetical protein
MERKKYSVSNRWQCKCIFLDDLQHYEEQITFRVT